MRGNEKDYVGASERTREHARASGMWCERGKRGERNTGGTSGALLTVAPAPATAAASVYCSSTAPYAPTTTSKPDTCGASGGAGTNSIAHTASSLPSAAPTSRRADAPAAIATCEAAVHAGAACDDDDDDDDEDDDDDDDDNDDADEASAVHSSFSSSGLENTAPSQLPCSKYHLQRPPPAAAEEEELVAAPATADDENDDDDDDDDDDDAPDDERSDDRGGEGGGHALASADADELHSLITVEHVTKAGAPATRANRLDAAGDE